MTEPPAGPRRGPASSTRGRLAVVLLTAAIVFLQGGWLTGVMSSPDPADAALRDWVAFYRTAVRVVEGDSDQVYLVDFQDDGRADFQDHFYFLYPPFTIWATLPLALLAPLGAYLACAGGVALVTLLAMWGIVTALRPRPPAPRRLLLWGAASAPWNAAVMLGHLGAGLLAAPALALSAWTRGRPGWSGAALGILVAKPNWGLPVLLLLALARRWHMVGGFLASCIVLAAVSLPLGTELWSDWYHTMTGYSAIAAEAAAGLPWRQATLFGALQSVSPPGWARVVWLPLAGIGFAGVSAVWLFRGRDDDQFPRILGIAFLGILVTNPYGYFYDALLAFPAGAVLWAGSGGWRRPRLRVAALTVSATTWGWMHLQFLVLMSRGPSLVGFGLAAWLVLEILDLLLPPAPLSADRAPAR